MSAHLFLEKINVIFFTVSCAKKIQTFIVKIQVHKQDRQTNHNKQQNQHVQKA